MKTFKKILLFFILIPFVASIPVMLVSSFGLDNPAVFLVGTPCIMLIEYLLLRKSKNIDENYFKIGMYINGIALLVLTIIFTIMMIIAEGSTSSVIMTYFCYLLFPFAPNMIVLMLMSQYEVLYIMAFVSYLLGFVVCAVLSKSFKFKKVIIPALCIVLCISSCTYLYLNRPATKYQGHGFDYMNGYSSTDFEDYTVYAKNSKLVTLDHQADFIIENEEDMPVLDGAEACYPLYSAFAKAVYKDIDEIEKGYLANESLYGYENGKIVTFTNTILGLDRLILYNDEYINKVDMFFGARPSAEQLEYARENGVELEITPIGKEAFVFFVEEDNSVSDLTSDQIRQIYHGDIKNWKELGGENQKIMAFQRPANSGSQTMMTYFMKDVSLKEPKKYETVSAMEGVISEVAQYNNEAGAMGYTFRYFLEELNQEQGVKMLSVNGVYPSLETIEDGTYPITVDLCLITRKDDPNPNVQKMKEFILSKDGQYIIHQTGYGRLNS